MTDTKKPKISVLMSVASEPKYHLTNAINSILSQTMKDFEFIIILDDPKNIEAKRLLNAFAKKDRRIMLLENKEKSGLAYSLNRGLEVATGKFIARMDADDISLPERFDLQLQYMQANPKVDFLFGWVGYINEQNSRLGDFKPSREKALNLDKYFFKGHMFVHPTLLAKATALKEEKYDPEFKRSQDFELWMRSRKRRNFDILEKIILLFRLPEEKNITTRVSKARNFNKYAIKAMNKNMNANAFNIWFWKFYFGRWIEAAPLHLPKKILEIFANTSSARYQIMKKDQVLGLIFTSGASLKTWVDKGMFGREKLIYEMHLKKGNFSKIYWFTYGKNDAKLSEALKQKKMLDKRIEIVPMPKIFIGLPGRLLYSVMLPIIHRKKIKECTVLKTNQMLGSWAWVIAKKMLSKPLVVRTGYTYSISLEQESKSAFKNLAAKKIEKSAFQNADAIILPRKEDSTYIQKRYGVKPNKINILYNYVDTTLFEPKHVEKDIDLLFVGRLEKQKNLIQLLKGLAKTKYSLYIIGTGAQKDNLIAEAKKLNLDKQITFVDQVPNTELPRYYNRSKLYVLPSLYEGMPKTLLEAMSCGCACLASDIPGTREVIVHSHSGWLTRTDASSIKKNIDHLMHNSSLRQKLGRNSRKRIEEKFSIESFLLKETEIMNKVKEA